MESFLVWTTHVDYLIGVRITGETADASVVKKTEEGYVRCPLAEFEDDMGITAAYLTALRMCIRYNRKDITEHELKIAVGIEIEAI